MENGVVHFMPVETAVSDDVLLRDLLGDRADPGNKVYIHEKPRRIGNTFLILASSPVFSVELRFSPDVPSEGRYEIRGALSEAGNPIKVMTQEKPFPLSSLVENFANRF